METRFILLFAILLLLPTTLRAWNPEEFKNPPRYIDSGGENREFPGWELLQNGQPLEQVPDTDMRVQAPFEFKARRDVDLDIPDFSKKKQQRPLEPLLPMLHPTTDWPPADANARLDIRLISPSPLPYTPWSRQLSILHNRKVNSFPRRDPLKREKI